LLGDERNGDIENVQFILMDEMEEKVKRTFEHLQPNCVRGPFL
jgi:hypothetical protein